MPAPSERFHLTPAARARLLHYARCMRAHGVHLPDPNPDGSSQLFDLSGINVTSPAFEKAAATCRPLIGSLA